MKNHKQSPRRSFLQSVVGVLAISSASFMTLVSSGCSPQNGSSAGDSDADAQQTMVSDPGDQSGREASVADDLAEETANETDSSDQSGRASAPESDSDEIAAPAGSDQSDQSGRSMSEPDHISSTPTTGGEGTDSDSR